jgi:hypothetical protein
LTVISLAIGSPQAEISLFRGIWSNIMIRTVATAFSLLSIFATAALAQQPNIEELISASIDCSQWKQNADGSWDTGPKAVIAGFGSFPNNKRLTLKGNMVNGVDTTAILEKKCGGR